MRRARLGARSYVRQLLTRGRSRTRTSARSSARTSARSSARPRSPSPRPLKRQCRSRTPDYGTSPRAGLKVDIYVANSGFMSGEVELESVMVMRVTESGPWERCYAAPPPLTRKEVERRERAKQRMEAEFRQQQAEIAEWQAEQQRQREAQLRAQQPVLSYLGV